MERLAKVPKAYKEPFPPILLDQSLPSNATYKPEQIILGNVQSIFQTFDDSLALIYHEYIHHLLYQKQKFKVALDQTGNIVQWMTDETYLYTPFPEEIALYLKEFEAEELPKYTNYEQMLPQEKERIIKEMEEVFSQTQKNPFKYAPSNLAKEEIFVYKQQLRGEKLGLFSLSEDVRQNLHIRIKQFKLTYKERRRYEKKHKLSRRGEKKQN